MAWNNEANIESKQYTCGYCGNLIASSRGFFSKTGGLRIYICPHCDLPSFFDSRSQIPGVAPGNNVEHLPEEVDSLYSETRKCVSIGSYTSAVLSCRKLLMNIAVEKGAKKGESFLFYVSYLADEGYVPPNGKGWVDHIRKKGNEATHEIELMSQDDATELIQFAEMLLKFIYEFPNKIPSQSP